MFLRYTHIQFLQNGSCEVLVVAHTLPCSPSPEGLPVQGTRRGADVMLAQSASSAALSVGMLSD